MRNTVLWDPHAVWDSLWLAGLMILALAGPWIWTPRKRDQR